MIQCHFKFNMEETSSRKMSIEVTKDPPDIQNSIEKIICDIENIRRNLESKKPKCSLAKLDLKMNIILRHLGYTVED